MILSIPAWGPCRCSLSHTDSRRCFLSGCGMQILSFLCSMGADRPRISRAFRRSGSGPPDEELERHVTRSVRFQNSKRKFVHLMQVYGDHQN